MQNTSSTNNNSQQQQQQVRARLFDSCHRKIRLFGECPYSFSFFGGLVSKARRKDRDGDQTVPDTKPPYLDENVLERKLPDADLRTMVDLPAGLDYNEWLASHTLAIVEHVNLVYGTISEFCTTSGCPDMTGPGTRLYLWFDEKGKKTRVAAPQYIDYVMTFTQKTVTDETIFPTKYANEFPSSFESIARKILRLLYHVIAHLYAAHFREIVLLGLHTHLNLTFAHLTALHRRFNLIDPKETEVLHDLEVALRLTEDSTGSDSTAAPVASTTSPPLSGDETMGNGGTVAGPGPTTTTTTGVTAASTTAAAAAAVDTTVYSASGNSGAAAVGGANQTGAIKCKSSINCGITSSGTMGGSGGGGSGGDSMMMFSGGLDIRPPIVNQPESCVENNVFT